jgi:hypothetical protein
MTKGEPAGRTLETGKVPTEIGAVAVFRKVGVELHPVLSQHV